MEVADGCLDCGKLSTDVEQWVLRREFKMGVGKRTLDDYDSWHQDSEVAERSRLFIVTTPLSGKGVIGHSMAEAQHT